MKKRVIPNKLLQILENWLADCFACVRSNGSWSDIFFCLCRSSTRFCAITAIICNIGLYVDDIGKLSGGKAGIYILLYADDILLLSPSVSKLQKSLAACEDKLEEIMLYTHRPRK